MDKKEKRKIACNSDEESLGILSMENLKVFGDSSDVSVSSSDRVIERLKRERLKAAELLKKTKNESNFRENKTATFNGSSDYVAVQAAVPINITDLMTDETINVDSSAKDLRISFEPAEMTGRSTHIIKAPSKALNSASSSEFSVQDILSASFAQKVRTFSQTLIDSDYNYNRAASAMSARASSSIFDGGYNGTQSLPRTADLSHITRDETLEGSFNGGAGFSFSTAGGAAAQTFSDVEFAPGELMQSKLIMDEISWANEFAAIPTAAMSKAAKNIVNEANNCVDITKPFFSPSTTTTNSMIAADGNFSMGNFFNMRSEKLGNIVRNKSPDKFRAPVALVDDSNESNTTAAASAASDISITPKIDNKTYSKALPRTTAACNNKAPPPQHESKDSGNASDSSFMFTLSAIDRAIGNLQLNNEDSETSVINHILAKTKKNPKQKKSPAASPNEHSELQDIREAREVAQSLGAEMQTSGSDFDLSALAEFILGNKENLDPNAMHGARLSSDTVSFTDSLLNSSEMKQLQQRNSSGSRTQQRSPLSPMSINIQITPAAAEEAGEDADVDEWPSTPIKSPNRRVRRTKSPHEAAACKCTETATEAADADATPMNKATTTSYRRSATNTNTQLCSTRLDSSCQSGVEQRQSFGISPNLTQPNKSARLRADSPLVFESSPMSSPRSHLSPQPLSPANSGFRSPQLDSTTNSDRRYLCASLAVAKTASSPVHSESAQSGAAKYGSRANNSHASAPAQRSLSANSLRNVVSTTTRSASRCSNNSEFSHRDGKVIPLKVTTLQLNWGSTKLRTDVRKSMQVKNIGEKRLVVRIEIHGPGFQLVNARSNMLTLQSQECSTIMINFCPTMAGVAIGALSFHAPTSNSSSSIPAFLEVPLYGYGGHAHIVLQGIIRSPVGSAFITMGDVRDLGQPFERSFQLYNKGAEMAFFIIKIDMAGLNLQRKLETFEVHPQHMLLAANSMTTVRVIFNPRREDTRSISKKITNVLTLANMRIICGDDANRQRMRKLVRRMSTSERTKLSINNLDELWQIFPTETPIADLDKLKEKSDVLLDLMCSVRVHDVTLTLNNENLNETSESMSIIFPDAEDTVLFRTIYAASPTPQTNALDPVNEVDAETNVTVDVDDECAVSSTSVGSWSVRPCNILFDFNAKRRTERVSLLLRNNFKSRQYFEVVCTHPALFTFTPNEGYVAPDGGQVEIEVHTPLKQPPAQWPSEPILIRIYMENERITVPVKFPKDNYPEDHFR